VTPAGRPHRRNDPGLITPHRVLADCANAWVPTRSGTLPVILATTPAAWRALRSA